MGIGIFGVPFGWVMRFIFETVQNYGLALLLFTVLTRVIMIPVAIKQTKSTAKMAMIQPQIKEIQQKYQGNRAKINEETMALYSKSGYNPASGCLPMIIQLVILFGVIDVIFRPLTHILRLPATVIQHANYITQGLGDFGGRAMNAVELTTLNALNEGLADYTAIGATYVAQMRNFLPQMDFLNINLMATPDVAYLMPGVLFTNFNPIVLIPILSGITSVFLTMATMNQVVQPQVGGPNMKIMMYMMPVFSLVFTFSVPAGVGIYWIYANVVGYVQARVLHKFFNPKELAEKAAAELEEKKERERAERIEAKKKAKENTEESGEEPAKTGKSGKSGKHGKPANTAALSRKERVSNKLAEARRRDAEKYGEQYDDDDSED